MKLKKWNLNKIKKKFLMLFSVKDKTKNNYLSSNNDNQIKQDNFHAN